MKIYKKAILPLGFKANGVTSGIKKSGKLDVALFYCDTPAKAACLFTANAIQAAPIQLNKRYLKDNRYYRAIIANSGNANCFTGKLGLNDAEKTTDYVARALNCRREDVLVASTGIIGKRLPLMKLKKAIPCLAKGLARQGIDRAKRAILTTDTFTKEFTVRFNIRDEIITISGIAKGAGMIAPNLATMLSFIFTDANITQTALNKALKFAVDSSFNCITVDGCMSTNDSIILLANAAAGNDLIDTKRNFSPFVKSLNTVCLELARLIVKDAEGASKFIQIKVNKAKSFTEAKTVALSIANSNLFKTAMYGENPNFGRIVAAAGVSGVDIKEEDLRIKVGPLNKKDIFVCASLGRGNAQAAVYTSDLTPEYIKINAEYN